MLTCPDLRSFYLNKTLSQGVGSDIHEHRQDAAHLRCVIAKVAYRCLDFIPLIHRKRVEAIFDARGFIENPHNRVIEPRGLTNHLSGLRSPIIGSHR